MTHRTSVAVGVLVALGTGGCGDSPTVPPPAPTHWVGELAAEEDVPLEGTVTVESTALEFTAGIEISGGVEGTSYAWYVGTGATCGDPETRLGDPGDYDALEPNEDGEASAGATIAEGLDEDSEYHVAVVAEDEDETLLGCAELTVDD